MAQVSFVQVVGSSGSVPDPASGSPAGQTCRFTFNPPFRNPEFIAVLRIRRQPTIPTSLEGTLTFGTAAAPSSATVLKANHAKFVELNDLAQLNNGFALKITYESTTKAIVNVQRQQVASASATRGIVSVEQAAVLESGEDAAIDDVPVVTASESASIEGVVALAPPSRGLEQHADHGK